MKMIWRAQYQSKVSGYGWNDFFFFFGIYLWKCEETLECEVEYQLIEKMIYMRISWSAKKLRTKKKGCSAFAKKPMLHSTKYLHDLQIFTVCLYRVISYWVSLRWLRDGTFQGKEIRIESKKFMDFQSKLAQADFKMEFFFFFFFLAVSE